MSAVTVSDIVSTNLLSELNLNPTWEKYHGYWFAGIILTSLYPFYQTLNGLDLHCVPKNDSKSWENRSPTGTGITDGELSGPQTAYVNSQCATDKKLWFPRYAGAIMLGMAIGMLIVSSFWLHFKNVKDGVRTFSDARNKFLKSGLSREEIFKLCSKPLYGRRCELLSEENAEKDLVKEMKQPGYNSKAHKVVRDAIRLFAYHMSDGSIVSSYLKRNKLLLLSIFIIMLTLNGLGLPLLAYTEQLSKGVTCRTNGNSGISFKEFICTSNYTKTIFAYLIVYCVMLSIQLFSTVHTIACFTKCDKFLPDAICTINRRRTLGLLVRFMKSASPIQYGLFNDIVVHIHSSTFKDELAKNMKIICENEDHELIGIKSKLFGDTSEVISALYDIFLDISQLRIKMSINAVKSAQYSMNHHVCKNIKQFILQLKKKNMVSNELIVHMFKKCDDTDVIHLSGVKECINLDDIENRSRSNHSKRSILYYAFSKECLSGPHKFAAAKALCQGKEETALSIHEMPANTIKTLRQYLKQIYLENKEVEQILAKCDIISTNTCHCVTVV